jgi:lysophospholipase L1-like esterase
MDSIDSNGVNRKRFRRRPLTLATVTVGFVLVACGSNEPAPVETGGSGAAAGSGGSVAGVGGAGTGTIGGGAGSGAGTGGTIGTSGGGGGTLSGAGGSAGGSSGSGSSGAGAAQAGAGSGGVGTGGGASAGDGAGGSAAGSAATGGASGTTAAGSAGQPAAGAGGAAACVKGAVQGDDVLLIGDSFIALSRDITKDLNTLARDAGALAANDAYRDNSVSGTQLSGGIAPTIPQQYVNGQQEAPVKIVIMDGGGNDMLNNTCSEPPMPSCQGIQNAVTAVEELFSQMGSDGVESVVYFFYPENQKNATQRAKVDVLRSLLQEVCAASVSPRCYEVDLRPVFEGHFTEYVLSDGIHPTAAGSRASAEAIWKVMQDNCIAQ